MASLYKCAGQKIKEKTEALKKLYPTVTKKQYLLNYFFQSTDLSFKTRKCPD
jgi:hypothetical protein